MPAEYVDAGHVTHGYAITGHKAQGMTSNHVFVLGSDTIYREWGYVSMSRGRGINRLYTVETSLDHEDRLGSRRKTRSTGRPLALTRALHRLERESLAVERGQPETAM